LDNVVLPNALEGRLSFLTDLGVNFGGFVENIGGGFYAPIWIFSGFVLVLMFKNSIQKINKLQLNYKMASLAGLAFTIGVLSLNKVSEFLYFNF
jgi:alginate O-acetyltransferase complex protein AlgI